MKKLTVIAAIFAVAAAFGASAHRITLDKPAVVSGTELKAGDYRLELDGEKLTLAGKKASADAVVKVESGSVTYKTTSVCCLGADGKYDLQEIRIGGTNTKLTMASAPSQQAATK